MQVVKPKATLKTMINQHNLEIRFTSVGKKIATWYDEGRDTHFITWNDGIIDALYDATEGGNDVWITVNGEARRKDNRTEFLVNTWYRPSPMDMETES